MPVFDFLCTYKHLILSKDVSSKLSPSTYSNSIEDEYEAFENNYILTTDCASDSQLILRSFVTQNLKTQLNTQIAQARSIPPILEGVSMSLLCPEIGHSSNQILKLSLKKTSSRNGKMYEKFHLYWWVRYC